MRIKSTIEKIVYISDADDWEIAVENNQFAIKCRVQDALTFASGVNLDNLAELIREAKIDAARKGIKWEAR